MPDEGIIRPPDQVAAGGTPAAPDQGGIIDALRSRGPAPQSALANIMAPPMQSNLGSAIGSGMLSGLQGEPTANPYLSGVNQQNKDQFYQQLNMQRERDKQAAQAFRQNEASLKIMKDTLEMLPEGPARDSMAKTYAGGIAKFTGQKEAGDLAQALAMKKVSPEEVNGILMDAAGGMDPKLIALRHPDVGPQNIQKIIKTDPKTLERLGMESADARKQKVLQGRLKEIQLIEAEYPPVKGHPEMIQTMTDAHRKLNQGKSFEEGDAASRSQAYEIAKLKTLDAAAAQEAQQDARKLALFGQEALLKEGISSRLQTQKDIAAEGRAASKEQAAAVKKTSAADEKKRQALVVAKTFLEQYKSYIDQLDEGGFLPKDGGVFEASRANVKQGHVPIPGLAKPNDPVWRGWLDLQGNMIGFARSVQNDIGPRAMAAFNQAVRVSEHPPTKAGLQQIYKQMQEQIKAAETGEVPGGIGPLQGDPKAVYKSLRDQGMTPQAAAAELKKRGYAIAE